MFAKPETRSLDDWYRQINSIYLDRNFYRDSASIFAHLVEVMGGLSLLASTKRKQGVEPERFIPKAIAWWMALCGKVGIRSIEEMIWWKFPRVCTYCNLRPHSDDVCREMKRQPDTPNWKKLEQIGKDSLADRPRTPAQWLFMFGEIYPVVAVEDYPATFARFTEELGELAEALRVFPAAPGYFLSEAADVFAWLMHLQNLMHSKGDIPRSERGNNLIRSFSNAYPDKCKDCGNPVCTCPPILPGTLGRIAHEVPAYRASFSEGGALLPVDEIIKLFELGTRTIKLDERIYPVDAMLIREIHTVVIKLKEFAVENRQIADAHSIELINAIENIKELTSAQRVTQESLETLAHEIANLPYDARTTVMNFLTNVAAGPWVAALLALIDKMVK